MCTSFATGDLRWPMPNPAGGGLPNPQAYETSMPGVVVDKVTGLTWKQVAGPARYTQEQAIAYCAGLGEGWRLPTLIELVSIVDVMQSPSVDPAAFPGTVPEEHWTATGSAGSAWYVDLENGLSNFDAPTRMGSARCVR